MFAQNWYSSAGLCAFVCWPTCRLIHWLIEWLIDQLNDWLTGWSIDWLIIDWLTVWSIDWLHWLIEMHWLLLALTGLSLINIVNAICSAPSYGAPYDMSATGTIAIPSLYSSGIYYIKPCGVVDSDVECPGTINQQQCYTVLNSDDNADSLGAADQSTWASFGGQWDLGAISVNIIMLVTLQHPDYWLSMFVCMEMTKVLLHKNQMIQVSLVSLRFRLIPLFCVNTSIAVVAAVLHHRLLHLVNHLHLVKHLHLVNQLHLVNHHQVVSQLPVNHLHPFNQHLVNRRPASRHLQVNRRHPGSLHQPVRYQALYCHRQVYHRLIRPLPALHQTDQSYQLTQAAVA
jgi:hypothetical protein